MSAAIQARVILSILLDFRAWRDGELPVRNFGQHRRPAAQADSDARRRRRAGTIAFVLRSRAEMKTKLSAGFDADIRPAAGGGPSRLFEEVADVCRNFMGLHSTGVFRIVAWCRCSRFWLMLRRSVSVAGSDCRLAGCEGARPKRTCSSPRYFVFLRPAMVFIQPKPSSMRLRMRWLTV